MKPKTRTHRPTRSQANPSNDAASEFFTVDEIKELKRQLNDARDPTRYMIRNDLKDAVGMAFYYNLSEDIWTTGQEEGTLFKRLPAAQAILKLLGREAGVVKVSVKDGKIRGVRANAAVLAELAD